MNGRRSRAIRRAENEVREAGREKPINGARLEKAREELKRAEDATLGRRRDAMSSHLQEPPRGHRDVSRVATMEGSPGAFRVQLHWEITVGGRAERTTKLTTGECRVPATAIAAARQMVKEAAPDETERSLWHIEINRLEQKLADESRIQRDAIERRAPS